MKKNRRKERKGESIKERYYPELKIYDSRGRIIGTLKQGQSVNYQELLLKKVR